MDEIGASTLLLCKQCAAALVVEQGAKYATCEYCGTVNFLDKSEVVLHYAVRPTIDGDQAKASLRRWMAGNQTVKGLDTAARIDSQEFEFFPMWMARTEDRGKEVIHLKPAAALSIVGLGELRVPASDLMPYDDSLDDQAMKPTVPVTALRSWLTDDEGIAAGAIREISLVHLPIYQFKYYYKGQTYTALIDGATSQVFAAIYPSKFELPYLSIAGCGCLAYFVAAFIPLISTFTLGSNVVESAGVGIILYLMVAVVLAIPIFIIAASVSRKF
ncbi:MAG: hypothetical protein LC131_17115 [Anaerolineae bacterium]|nr:hypothetical protein [Anaerolineae bacterium]